MEWWTFVWLLGVGQKRKKTFLRNFTKEHYKKVWQIYSTVMRYLHPNHILDTFTKHANLNTQCNMHTVGVIPISLLWNSLHLRCRPIDNTLEPWRKIEAMRFMISVCSIEDVSCYSTLKLIWLCVCIITFLYDYMKKLL